MNIRLGTRNPGIISHGRVVIARAGRRPGEDLERTGRRQGAERDRVDKVGDPDRIPQQRQRPGAGAEPEHRPGDRQRGDADENVAPAGARGERRRQFSRRMENDENHAENPDRVHRDQRGQGNRQHRVPDRGESEEGAGERGDGQRHGQAQSGNAEAARGIERPGRSDREHKSEPCGENAGDGQAPGQGSRERE